MVKCNHSKTEMKLVAWANKCKGKHSQGFKWVKCCARCGCVIKSERENNSGDYVRATSIPEFARIVATEFYYWWHNHPGANTQDGFQDWWEANKDRFIK